MFVKIDDAKRRVVMKAAPGFSGAVISRDVARRIRTAPSLASYDFVIDVRESDTGSTMEDFKIDLKAYREVERSPGLKFGCYVSTDPNYPLWAQAMADFFEDRICRVYLTTEQCDQFLDRERGFSPA